jgi:hypothetical protein
LEKDFTDEKMSRRGFSSPTTAKVPARNQSSLKKSAKKGGNLHSEPTDEASLESSPFEDNIPEENEELDELSSIIKSEFKLVYKNIDFINESIKQNQQVNFNKRKEFGLPTTSTDSQDVSKMDKNNSLVSPSNAVQVNQNNDLVLNKISEMMQHNFQKNYEIFQIMNNELKSLRDQNSKILREMELMKATSASLSPSYLLGPTSTQKPNIVFANKEHHEIIAMKKEIQLLKVEVNELKESLQQMNNFLGPKLTEFLTTFQEKVKFLNLAAPSAAARSPSITHSNNPLRLLPSRAVSAENNMPDAEKSFAQATKEDKNVLFYRVGHSNTRAVPEVVTPPPTEMMVMTSPAAPSRSERKSIDQGSLPPLRQATPDRSDTRDQKSNNLVVPRTPSKETAAPSSNGLPNVLTRARSGSDSTAKLNNFIQSADYTGIHRIIQLSEELPEIGPFSSLLRNTFNLFKNFKCNKGAVNDFILRLNHLCFILSEFFEQVYLGDGKMKSEEREVKEGDDSENSAISHNGPFNKESLQIELQKSLIFLKEILYKIQKYFISFTKLGFLTEKLLFSAEPKEKLRNFDVEVTNEIINICSLMKSSGYFTPMQYSQFIQKIELSKKYDSFLCNLIALYGRKRSNHRRKSRLDNFGSNFSIDSNDRTEEIEILRARSESAAVNDLEKEQQDTDETNLSRVQFEPIEINNPEFLETLRNALQMTSYDFRNEIDYYKLFLEKKSYHFYYSLVDNDWNYYILENNALKLFWKSRFPNQNNIEKLIFLTNVYDYLVKKDQVSIPKCEMLIQQLTPILDVINEVYNPVQHHLLQQQQQQAASTQQHSKKPHHHASAASIGENDDNESVAPGVEYKINIFKMNQFTKFLSSNFTLFELLEQLLINVNAYQCVVIPQFSSLEITNDPNSGNSSTADHGHHHHHHNNSSVLLTASNLHQHQIIELKIEKMEEIMLFKQNITFLYGKGDIGKSSSILSYLHYYYIPTMQQRNFHYHHVQKYYNSILWLDFLSLGRSRRGGNHSQQQEDDEEYFILQQINKQLSLGVLLTPSQYYNSITNASEENNLKMKNNVVLQEFRKLLIHVLSKQKHLHRNDSNITIFFNNITVHNAQALQSVFAVLSEFAEHLNVVVISSTSSEKLLQPSSDSEKKSSSGKIKTSHNKMNSDKNEIELIRNLLIPSSSKPPSNNNSVFRVKEIKYDDLIISSKPTSATTVALLEDNNHNEAIEEKMKNYLVLTARDKSRKTLFEKHYKDIARVFQYNLYLLTNFAYYVNEEILNLLLKDFLQKETGNNTSNNQIVILGRAPSTESRVSVTNDSNPASPNPKSESTDATPGTIVMTIEKLSLHVLKQQLYYYFLTPNDLMILYSLIPLLYLSPAPHSSDSGDQNEGMIINEEMVFCLVKEYFPKNNDTMIVFKECLDRLVSFHLLHRMNRYSSNPSSYSAPINPAATGKDNHSSSQKPASNHNLSSFNLSTENSNNPEEHGRYSYNEYYISRKTFMLLNVHDYVAVQNKFAANNSSNNSPLPTSPVAGETGMKANTTRMMNKLTEKYTILTKWIYNYSNRDYELNQQYYEECRLSYYFDYVFQKFICKVHKSLATNGQYLFQPVTPSTEKSTASFTVLPANHQQHQQTRVKGGIQYLSDSGDSSHRHHHQSEGDEADTDDSADYQLLYHSNYYLNDYILLLQYFNNYSHVENLIFHLFEFIEYQRKQSSAAQPQQESSIKEEKESDDDEEEEDETNHSSARKKRNYFDDLSHGLSSSMVHLFTKSIELIGKYLLPKQFIQQIYEKLFDYFNHFEFSLYDIFYTLSLSKELQTLQQHNTKQQHTSEGLPMFDMSQNLILQSKNWSYFPENRFYLLLSLRNLSFFYSKSSITEVLERQKKLLLSMSGNSKTEFPLPASMMTPLPTFDASEVLLLLLYQIIEHPLFEELLLEKEEYEEEPEFEAENLISFVEIAREKSKILHLIGKLFLSLTKYPETLRIYEENMKTLQTIYFSQKKANLLNQNPGFGKTANVASKSFDEEEDAASKQLKDEEIEENLFSVYEKTEEFSSPTLKGGNATNQQKQSNTGMKNKPALLLSPSNFSTSLTTAPTSSSSIASSSTFISPASAAAALLLSASPFSQGGGNASQQQQSQSSEMTLNDFLQLIDIGILYYNIASVEHLMKNTSDSLKNYFQALKFFQNCQEFLSYVKQKSISTTTKTTAETGPNKTEDAGSTTTTTTTTTNMKYSLFHYHYSRNILSKIASTYNCISIIYYEMNQFAKSLTYSQKLVTYYNQIYGKHHYYVANLCNNIANLLLLTNQRKESIKYYEKSLKIYHKVTEQNLFLTSAANANSSTSNNNTATPQTLLNLESHEEEIANIFYNLGNVYKSLYLSKDSIKNYEKAKNIFKQLLIHEQQQHLQSFNHVLKASAPHNSNVTTHTPHHHQPNYPVGSGAYAASNTILHYQNLISDIQKHIDSLST